MKLKRILIKFSGEQLAGKHGFGVDIDVIDYLAEELKPVLAAGCQVVIVAGGGNIVRGASLAGHGIRRVTADQLGMLSGLMNSMAITDIFESHGIAMRCLSNIFADQVAESYNFRRANNHLNHNRLIMIAGGIARPYFTHDTAAVSLALELGCDVMLKSTMVDGVYDKDPKKHEGATKIDHMSFQEAVENQNVQVMDKAALGLAMEQNMPVVVFDMMQPGNLLKLVNGKALGTRIDANA